MADTYDLIIRGGTLVNQDGTGAGDVGVRNGKIAAIGDLHHTDAREVLVASGLHVLPGVIDTQVHFREPGLDHKEDLLTGSRAAVAGGVTAVFEMPNTSPTTTDAAALANKVTRGTDRMFCDFAFFMGASAENAAKMDELELTPGCCGVKIFMGSSTGDLLVAGDEDVLNVLSHGRRRVAIHSEDENRLIERMGERVEGDPSSHPVWRDVESAVRCTKRLLKLARQAGRKVHVLHITTADEIPLLAANKDLATVEVTPQHLTMAADAYARLGTFAQMNPPIRDAHHRDGLWAAVRAGVVDVIGSDHAPHTREEKAQPYPQSPSGMPGVQTLVPIMLDHVNAGRLSLERFVDLTSHGPQRIYQIAGKGRMAVGYDADFTIVDMKQKREITEDWIESKSGWSPFTGETVTGWPMGTIVRGNRVMWDGVIASRAHGAPVRFQDTL
jgi:dihydroorotase